MGRDLSDASPSNVTGKSARAARAENILRDVPEFPMSTVFPGLVKIPPVPVISQQLLFSETTAPRALDAFRDERVSSEIKGERILEIPFAAVATATARTVCDFEPGTDILPDSCELRTFIFIQWYPLILCHFSVTLLIYIRTVDDAMFYLKKNSERNSSRQRAFY
jgi:hypothetical protein